MLYQDYKSKINKVVDVLRAIRKFRVLIIAIISAILVATGSFMGLKGVVVGAKVENDKIEYGSQPKFSASAMFSDVRYEYCRAGGNEWSATVPTNMGEYRVRAVGKGIFGERVGKEHSFTIVPKNVTVTALENGVVYGEMPNATASLAYGDRVYCTEFFYGDTTLAQTTVTPNRDTVVIKDKSGKDVTSNYNITVKTTDISFDKRDVTLTVESKSKEYDGTVLMHEVWNITGGNLVYGDMVVKVDGTFSFIIGAEIKENKGQFKVIRATENGSVDVTHQYNINQIAGTLEITQKPIIIIPVGGEYVYDGQVHSERDFTVDPSTPLLDGHIIEVVTAPEIVNVGETKNLLVMKVTSPNGDVTDNYSFTFVDDCILKVTPRPIDVTTESDSIVYDGLTHTFEGCYVSEETPLPEGHRVIVYEAVPLTDAGKEKNVLVIGVIDASGKDVTANYMTPNYTYGEIEITKKALSVGSSDFEFLYNGEEQKKEELVFYDSQICEGHRYEATFTSSVAECGEAVTNTYTLVIYDGAGRDVTDNYEIDKRYGTLTVRQLPIYIITDTKEKVYDGTELKAESFTYYGETNKILDKHVIKYIGAPSIVNASYESIDNIFTIEIYDSDGVEKTFNYDIHYMEYGTLTINHRVIYVSAVDYDKEYYDGESIEDYLEYVLMGDEAEPLAPEQTLTVDTYVEDYVSAGTRDYIITSAIVTDVEGNDVSANYIINIFDGTVSIGKRPITVTSAEFDKKVYYDGEKHRLEVYEVSSILEKPIVDGQYIVIEFLNSSYVEYATTDALNMFNVVGIFVEGTDEDVTKNYTVESIYGMLHLEKRPVSVISDSIPENTVVYDGYEHKQESFNLLATATSLGFVVGQTPYAKYTGVIVDAGEEINTFEIYSILDKNGEEVIDNYEITHEYGTLRVYPRPITLTSQSANKVYDDSALTNKNVIIGGMGVADGQRVKFSNFASITDAGSINNTFEYSIVFNSNGEAVPSGNYNVTIDDSAMLTVEKRKLTVTVNSVSKVYDGTPLTPDGYEVEQYWNYFNKTSGLLPLHTYSMELYGELYTVGSVDITHSEPVITKRVYISFSEWEDVDVTKNYEITVVDGTITVTERELILDVTDGEKEYDGMEYTPEYVIGGLGLAVGDTVEVTYDGLIIDAGTSTVTIKDYVITNGKGENVTFCYDVSRIEGTLTVNPRKIIITVNDGYKEYYDGGAVVSDGYSVDRLLTELGHEMDLTLIGEQINVGSSVASVLKDSVVITDSTGRNITFNYEYTVVDGELVVEKKRPITITSESATVTYDGKYHLFGGYTIGGMGLAPERDEIEIITFLNDSIRFVGTYTNEFTAEIILGSDRESQSPTYVTDNYEITYVFGTITVEKLRIKITTEGGEKVFDGTPLTNPNASYECNGFPENEWVQIITNGTITTVGSVNNTYTIDIFDKEEGFSTLGNYDVVDESTGVLKVTPLELTIESNTNSKTYDGTPLIDRGFSSNWEQSEAYKKGVLSLVVEITGERTEIGRSENSFTVKLLDKDGNDCIEGNCILTLKVGTLTVYADTITITSGNGEVVYDGREHKVFDKTVTGYINPEHTLKVVFTGRGKDAGTYENTFTYDFLDESGSSVKEFYPDVVSIYGTITVKPYDMVVEAPDVFKKYDGTVLYAPKEIVTPNKYLEELNKNFYGDKFTYVIGDTSDIFVTMPGEKITYTHKGKLQILLNGKAVPMSNFNVTYLEGTLELSKKTVEVSLEQLTQTYNGRPVKYYEDSWYLEGEQLLSGHYLDLKLYGELTEPGQLDIVALMDEMIANNRVHVYDIATGEDVTRYYEFKFVGTPLTVLERYVQVTAGSAEKKYDGAALVCDEYTITGGSLVRGHTIQSYKISGAIAEVGNTYNIISDIVIVDQDGNDVTHNYNIEYIKGILVIYDDN